MPFQKTIYRLKISKAVLLSITTITNVFAWFNYATSILIDEMSMASFAYHEELMICVIGICGAIFSMFIGIYLVNSYVTRKAFFLIWVMLGIFTSYTFAFLEPTIQNLLVIIFGVNFSFCLGIPVSLAYFAESTVEENRGRIASITLIIMFLTAYLLGIAKSNDTMLNSLVLMGWRSLGLIILLLGEEFTQDMKKTNPLMVSIISERAFALYIIPWAMFSMVNYLGWPLLAKIHGEDFTNFCASMGNIVAAISSIMAGYASDRIGRKRTLMIGFIIFGLGYAVVGIFPFNNLAWYFYMIVDGIAWGIIWVIFWFVIWGDLAHGKRSEKYYALGFLPYLVSSFLRVTVGKIIPNILSEYAVFSFSAFFLFLAVIPLMFAPETLPEKTIKERELKNYIEKAKKAREKFTEG